VAVVAGATALAAATIAVAVLGFMPTLDAPPAWGHGWSQRVVGADARWTAAVADRIALSAGLVAFAAGAGLVTLLLLGVGRREDGRAGLAVRRALGASRRRLIRTLVDPIRSRLGVMLATGVGVAVLAVAWGTAIWPEAPWSDITPSSATGIGALQVAFAAAALAGIVAAVALLGVLSPLPGLDARSPDLLRAGHGVTDDPRAGTLRRWATTGQIGASLALAIVGLGLAGGGASGPLEEADGVSAESLAIGRYAVTGGPLPVAADGATRLATPGTWLGIGARDLVTVDCGACSRGTLYLPVYGVDSTVHAVQPGVLAALGGRTVEGRGIEAGDDAGAEWVGVVNPAFRMHFENGEPIGRRIRLSGGGDRWVRVVGIVDMPRFDAPGAAGEDEPTLWLSLAQHPAGVVEGAVTGTLPANLRVIDEPRPITEVRQAVLAPLGWSGGWLVVSGLIVLLLAFAGSAEVAHVEARGRARAGAIRLALGASPKRAGRLLVLRAVRSTIGGVAVGLGVAILLERALGVVDGVGPFTRVAIVGGIGVAVWLGLRPAVRALGGLDPARLLRTE
jgi:hypothetical protein